ncbi:MAG: glycosyltransferase [Phycisphaera sp.]|nr:MAG: glycosyltransferase [Phycisphaera sp.]
MPNEAPPSLILLPGGLCVSGVSAWAARLASSLAERGSRVTLALFANTSPGPSLDFALSDNVRVLDLTHLPPVEWCQGNISAYMPAIMREALELSRDEPVCVLPNLHGDCFGIAASLAVSLGNQVRIVGTAHSDNIYDEKLLTHYEPMLSKLVCVSDTLESKVRDMLTMRRLDIANAPYGVDVPDALAARSPIADRPIRLIYAGRFEHRQKRVAALPLLSGLLTEQSIAHEMTIVGEGPAKQDLIESCQGCEHVTLRGKADQNELANLLSTHDAFVLPSRYEGLSIAMLEALAQGCVPVVTRSESGTEQAITHCETGMIADVAPDADEYEAARGLAACISNLLTKDTTAMSERAHADAKTRFSLSVHTDTWADVLLNAANSESRFWPASRPCAFTGGGGPSGSVPTGGAERLREVLAQLAGRPVVIHGGGRHTLDLAPLLANTDVRAIADDDPARFGEKLLGWRIIDPESAAMTGATDVVISSAMHEEAIWNRRGVYEEQGLRVHRLYHAARVETKPSLAASAISP